MSDGGGAVVGGVSPSQLQRNDQQVWLSFEQSFRDWQEQIMTSIVITIKYSFIKDTFCKPP